MIKRRPSARIGAALLSCAMLFTSQPAFPIMHANAAGDLIVNDCFWKDTKGNNIYSQGGGIFKFGDTYYWYGVHYRGAETYAAKPTGKNNDYTFVSVSCYSSKDLVNWKFENDVLTPKSKGWNWAYWGGRLGVAYCPKSKQYVLVTQYNDSVLFASCSSPTGNFEVKNVQDQIPNVLKQGTGDQTIFVDDDGQAYLICSNKGGRGHQYVAKLRESDYLAAEPAVEVAKGSGREGNCMFKYKGKYYFCASDLHGWNSSHSYYMVADNIYGPYTKWAVIDGTDEDFSHVTQTGFFYTIKGSKQETVLFCGDRWSDFAGNGLGYNQWVPLTVNGNNVKFNSLSEFHLNAQTGEWTVGENNNYILNPSFDADRVSQSTMAGWKNSGTGNSNSKGGRTGNWCMQQWSDKDFKGTLTQNVTLPNGTYTLKAYAKSNGSINQSYIYVKGYGGADKQFTVKDAGNNWKEVTIKDIQVTNGKCEVGIYTDAKAGAWIKTDDFTLIGKSSAATQPVTEAPTEPPTEAALLNGQLIRNVKIADSANAGGWSIENDLKTGDAVFGDRTFKFTSVPAKLQGAEWLKTACNSKKYGGDQASFSVAQDATVFLGVDSRIEATPPAWLSGWTKTTDTLTDDGETIVTYNVYRKDVKANDTVTIGMNGIANSVNFFAAVKPYEAAQTYLRGDLNQDGAIDVFDLALLKRGLTSGMDTLTAGIADVNADGKADSKDAEHLTKYLHGKAAITPAYYTEGETVQTPAPSESSNEVYARQLNGKRQMEYLNRGVSAVSTGNSVFVSWRSLASDLPETAFNVYRTTDGKSVKLNDAPVTGGTNYTDTKADLKKNNSYTVKAVVNGKELESDCSDTLPANSTQNVRIVNIKPGSQIHFVWVGDFDGDGTYDYLVDRNTDDHQKLEAYKSDGTYLYTIDLGYNSENKNNISPGPSAVDCGMWDGVTVYDMDCDGIADICLRIADGVTFGDGKKYTNSNSQAQEIAVIDGRTGSLKASAPVPQDYVNIGPMACMMEIGYLDGENPSVVCWMKNRNKDKTFNSVTCAYGYQNGKFQMQWKYKNEVLFNDRTEYKNGYAEAHQIRVADVDYDGKDEVLHMGYCLNGDGSLRYHIDEIVHGDRWFVGSFDNANNGKEMMGYGIQQNNQYGLLEYFYNASTGKMIWTNYAKEGTADVGRGNIGDIDPRYDGSECWSFQGLYNHNGKRIGDNSLYPCIRLWWDGDLLAESYNDKKLEKWNYQTGKVERLLSPWNITDCTGATRGAPMFYADITGDWREEVIMTSSDYSKLVILETTNPTDTRLYCLAQNPCYRNCMTAKGYFQSHMLDYYLGTGMQMPNTPDIRIIHK
ncbi:MAG: family 43 glycosylhydrolase [Oscillospiraceae bacterium]|nr:family 43 glycosylhydrolase [Oscillospiraceae bacterium]